MWGYVSLSVDTCVFSIHEQVTYVGKTSLGHTTFPPTAPYIHEDMTRVTVYVSPTLNSTAYSTTWFQGYVMNHGGACTHTHTHMYRERERDTHTHTHTHTNTHTHTYASTWHSFSALRSKRSRMCNTYILSEGRQPAQGIYFPIWSNRTHFFCI